MNFIYYQILLAILIFLPKSISAQQIISSQGNYAESSTMSLSWTIGDNFTETKQLDGQIITQGFQQPFLQVEEIVNTSPDIPSFEASIFPNPASDILNLNMKNLADDYLLEVFDVHGKLLHRSKRNGGMQQFEMNEFVPGQYFFKLSNPTSNQVSLFKIVKQ